MRLILLLLSISLSASAQSDTTQLIDQLFSQYNNATPGATVLVARGEKVLYHKAFGLADLEHAIPNTTETVYECGSVSKQFTATAALVLAAQGKFSLTDDIRKFIPELPVYDAPITIQHLLNHTSGLKDWGSVGELTGWPRTTRVYTNNLALHIICKQKSTNFTPGTEYSYSNSNYTLLTFLVERVSKKSLAAFTDSVFFQPLHMNSTRWRNNFRTIVPNRAIAYQRYENRYQQQMPFEDVHGHGGLLTTTGDLLKWNLLLANPDVLGQQVSDWRTMRGVLKNGRTLTYASGIVVNVFNQQPEISHSGATAGYRAWLAYYPKQKLSVILLSNDSRFDLTRIATRIAETYLGKGNVSEPKARTAITWTTDQQQKWQGIYKHLRGSEYIELKQEKEKMLINGTAIQLIHTDTIIDGRRTFSFVSGKGIRAMNAAGDTVLYRKVKPPMLSSSALSGLVGTYRSAEAETSFTITTQNQKIYYQRDPDVRVELTPAFLDAFRDEDFWLYEFIRDKKGNVTGCTISLGRARAVPFVKVI